MEISREELELVVASAMTKVLEAHVCTQFTKIEVDTLRDVAAVGSGIKKGMLRAASGAIVAGMIALFIWLGGGGNSGWTWRGP